MWALKPVVLYDSGAPLALMLDQCPVTISSSLHLLLLLYSFSPPVYFCFFSRRREQRPSLPLASCSPRGLFSLQTSRDAGRAISGCPPLGSPRPGERGQPLRPGTRKEPRRPGAINTLFQLASEHNFCLLFPLIEKQHYSRSCKTNPRGALTSKG